MPQAANITVKKNDGTTDIVYTSVIPSSGDKNDAIFRSLTVGLAPGNKPEFRARTEWNGPRTARRAVLSFTYPSLVTDSGGKQVVADRLNISVTAVIPQGMAQSDIDEGASQGLNILASALMKSVLKEGYAPT